MNYLLFLLKNVIY